MAAQHPLHCKETAADNAMALNSFYGVLRTRGKKTTARPEKGTDAQLITADGCDEENLH